MREEVACLYAEGSPIMLTCTPFLSFQFGDEESYGEGLEAAKHPAGALARPMIGEELGNWATRCHRR